MRLAKKKELIYMALAATNGIISLTWVQMAYNDPSFVQAWSVKDLCIIAGISSILVVNNMLIAWKAYLSDPRVVDTAAPPVDPNRKPPTEGKPNEETTDSPDS